MSTFSHRSRRAAVVGCAAVAAVFLLAGPAAGDDLTGADRFLCVTLEVTACSPESDCRRAAPQELNVPRFVQIDLAGRTLATTEASGENRQTPIEQMQRADGLIVLQGVQQSRAFSILVAESTGELTASVAREGLGVVVFGVCTPAPAAGRAGG